MKDNWVDFKLIKQAVTIEMILEHYRINWLRKNRNELRGRCPIHQGEGERSFHVNVVKNAFQCFSCKARGNVLDLVAAMEDCSVRDAALKLKEWFAVGESESSLEAGSQVASQPAVAAVESGPAGSVNPLLGFELRVDRGHEYGLSRGLSPETLECFEAGYCLSKGMFAGRFIVPLHNERGELVGYIGRSLDDSEPKYLLPSSEKGFYKSRLLFNLHRAVEAEPAIKLWESKVIVVEGVFDAMRVHQAGFSWVIALMGSSLSDTQEHLLVKHFDWVILMFDGDDAGRSATETCLVRLGRRLWVRAVELPDDTQPDQLSEDAIHELLDCL